MSLKLLSYAHCSKSSFFVQKFNFDFPRKIVELFWVKTRENAAVLDFLAVDKFDFTRKIVKKFWLQNSWKCWGFVLFSCWQLWFHEKRINTNSSKAFETILLTTGKQNLCVIPTSNSYLCRQNQSDEKCSFHSTRSGHNSKGKKYFSGPCLFVAFFRIWILCPWVLCRIIVITLMVIIISRKKWMP